MTRYPKLGKGRRWTVVELKAVPAQWKGDTLADGEGLSGEVRVSSEGAVSIRWKYAFRWGNKISWFQAGTWPNTKLDDIRRNRDGARDRLREGVNPTSHKQATRIEVQRKAEALIAEEAQRKARDLTVQDLFDTWLADGVARKDGNAALRRSFEKDVLPEIGSAPIRSVTEKELLTALRCVVKRGGRNRTAVVLAQDLKQMFGWAEKRKPWRTLLEDGNPAQFLKSSTFVEATYDDRNIRERWLRSEEIQELACLFVESEVAYANAKAGEKYQYARPLKKTSQLATWICLSTLSRIGETLSAEWKHVNLKAGTWFIPKENTKADAGDLTVDLSPFALRQFEHLHALTGHTKWLFPAKETDEMHVDVKSVTKQVGDRQTCFKKGEQKLNGRRRDDSLVLSSGENGKWVEHDLRRTGATMMQQAGVTPDMIDRCQNHSVRTKVQQAYQQHFYRDEMKAAWGLLGARLDELMSEVNTQRTMLKQVPLPHHLLGSSPVSSKQAA